MLAGDKLKRGRKIVGYGRNLSFFDNVDFEINSRGSRIPIRPTRKIFSDRRDELMNFRLITKIDIKNKRDKYYSITPLGICELLQDSYFLETMTTTTYRKILKILETFIASSNVKSIINLKNEVEDTRRFLKTLKFHDIQVLLHDIRKLGDNYLELFFPFSDDLYFKVASLRYVKEDHILLNESHRIGKYYDRILTEKELHAYVANFIVFWMIFGTTFYEFRAEYIYMKSPIFNKQKYLKPSILQKMYKIYFMLHNQIMPVNLFEDYLKHLSDGKTTANT